VADLSALYAADFDVLDDTRTVDYFVRVGASSYADPVAVGKVLRGAPTADDRLIDGRVIDGEIAVLHLARAEVALAGVASVKGGDAVGLGGARYQIQSYKVCDEGERFRCVCLREK
jgi:hypothetical protein